MLILSNLVLGLLEDVLGSAGFCSFHKILTAAEWSRPGFEEGAAALSHHADIKDSRARSEKAERWIELACRVCILYTVLVAFTFKHSFWVGSSHARKPWCFYHPDCIADPHPSHPHTVEGPWSFRSSLRRAPHALSICLVLIVQLHA